MLHRRRASASSPPWAAPSIAPALRIPAALAAVLCACGFSTLQAQSVSVYGLVDVAVEHVTKVAPAGGGLTRVPSLTGTLPSRLGLRGSEDLGGGLKAVFTLEQGFAPDQGSFTQGGRAWGRQAWVGVAGSWGTLTLGRHYTMLFWSILDADVMGPQLYGTGSLDAYIPNARADNSVAFKGSWGGLTLGATASLGRDAVNAGSAAGTNCAGELAGDTKACREWSVLVKVDAAAWGLALAQDTIHGGPGALFGLVRSALKDTRVSANGWVRMGGVKATLGVVRRDNQASSTPRSALWYAGLAWPVSQALTLEAQWHTLRTRGSAAGATLGVLRATHALSRRTAVYATAGHIGNRGGLALSVSGGAGGSSPLPGGAQSGLAAGLRHAF